MRTASVCAALCLAAVLCPSVGAAPINLNSATAPAPTFVGDPSRFAVGAGNVVTASYDTSAATAFARWSLGDVINQNRSFDMQVRFALPSDFYTSGAGGGQISFGLINTQGPVGQRTGTNRDGGPDFTGTSGTAYNHIGFDYFPSVSAFSERTVGPVVIQSFTGDTADFYSRIAFPFGRETALNDGGGEVDRLPAGATLRAELNYDAAVRTLTLRLIDETTGDPLNINGIGAGNPPGSGGADGDAFTIQNVLPAGADFAVDTFALTLWQITDTPTVADVVFQSFSVVSPVPIPEPSAVVLFAAAAGLGLWRLRRRAA